MEFEWPIAHQTTAPAEILWLKDAYATVLVNSCLANRSRDLNERVAGKPLLCGVRGSRRKAGGRSRINSGSHKEEGSRASYCGGGEAYDQSCIDGQEQPRPLASRVLVAFATTMFQQLLRTDSPCHRSSNRPGNPEACIHHMGYCLRTGVLGSHHRAIIAPVVLELLRRRPTAWDIRQ